MAKTVLIVDDSSSLRMLVKAALSKAGYQVIEAADGVEALERLEQAGRVHLIVSDVNMPRMDGIAFVATVKKDARHRMTPVVILTTEAGGSMIEKGKQAGAKAWMVKPFNPAQLLDTVAKLLPA